MKLLKAVHITDGQVKILLKDQAACLGDIALMYGASNYVVDKGGHKCDVDPILMRGQNNHSRLLLSKFMPYDT